MLPSGYYYYYYHYYYYFALSTPKKSNNRVVPVCQSEDAHSACSTKTRAAHPGPDAVALGSRQGRTPSPWGAYP